MKRALKWLALFAGLALLSWYLARVDWQAIRQSVSRLGWFAPLVCLPYLFTYLADCLGWRLAFLHRPAVSFVTLFRIRWSGESLNNVLPSAYIGGEALKVYLLQRKGVPVGEGTMSAVVSKTAQTVAQVVLIAIASVVFLEVGRQHPGLRVGMSLVLGAAVLVLIGLFWVQRRGLLGVLVALTRALRIRIPALESRRARIEEVDRTILRFYHQHPGRFLASTGAYLAGWLMDTTEILLVSHLIGTPITWSQALCVEAFTGVAKILGMWVPGALGVQESGIVLLSRLAGVPDSLSFTYALVRRAREVVFVVIGWGLFWLSDHSLSVLRLPDQPTQKSQTPADAT